jgi:hypothetical protein
MQTPRTEDELKNAASDVKYEIQMLRAAAKYVWSGISSPKGEETDLFLEAFLLHYRNLCAFLCPNIQRTSSDDVIASDFFVDSREAKDVVDSSELGRDKARIDKLLSHISYSRAEYAAGGEKDWDTDEMKLRIERGIKEFLRCLPPERRAWFESPGHPT